MDEGEIYRTITNLRQIGKNYRHGLAGSFTETTTPTAFTEARSKVSQWLFSAPASVSWDSVIGHASAKEAIREAIEASTTHAQLWNYYGLVAPNGLLLWGPPGNGKTMLAKAAATQLGGDELIVINGAEFRSSWYGVAAQQVKDVFAFAREWKRLKGVPLVVFVDEAEELLGDRTRRQEVRGGEVVGPWLAEMDGIGDNGAFVVLATNRPDELDEALLREGRVGRKVKIGRPSVEDAKEIASAMVGRWAREWDPKWVEQLYGIELELKELVNQESGAKHKFTLGHIASGAMVTGLIERWKMRAFERDKQGGGTATGATREDFQAALKELWEENKGLAHTYALEEFVQEVAIPAEQLRTNRRMR